MFYRTQEMERDFFPLALLAKVSFPVDYSNNGLMPKPDGLRLLYGLLTPN